MIGILGQKPGAPPRDVGIDRILYIKRNNVSEPNFGTILMINKTPKPIVIPVTNAFDNGMPVIEITIEPITTLIININPLLKIKSWERP